MPHVPGRDKLAFLEAHHLTAPGRSHQQIGLSAEKSRNLQDVQYLGGRSDLGHLMHIGNHRHTKIPADIGQDPQPLVQAGATEGIERGPIGLVERGLEHIGDAQPGADLRKTRSNLATQVSRLNDARPADQ